MSTLPLDRIDGDARTYRITDRAPDLQLAKSMKTVGLLNPPLLAASPGPLPKTGHTPPQWIVVCGFQRIEAARSLGWKALPARLLPAETSPLACARYAILDNSSQRSLNLMEQAHAYGLLGRVAAPAELPALAAELGLPDNRSFIRKMIALRGMPRLLQKAVRDDTIPLPVALQLRALPPDDALAMAKWFIDLQLNLNQQRQMFTFVSEIGKREHCSPMAILAEDNVQAILARENLQRPQLRQQVLAYLKKRRFPAITQAEEEFATLLKSLKLGERMRLVPPKHFEASNYNLGISFSSMAELRGEAQRLTELLGHPALKRICGRFLGDGPQ